MKDDLPQIDADIIERLFETICQRRTSTCDKSYTASLFAGGSAKISAKMREELQEFIESVTEGEDHHARTHEICDLLYHSFVMAVFAGVSLDDIKAELTRRFGTSGLEEKASRKSSPE